MSDSAYGWTYFGLNLASSVEQIVGNLYYLQATRLPRLGYDGKPNGYRYRTINGKMFDFDYPHGNINKIHFHGIPEGNLSNRIKEHWGFFRLIWWFIIGR